MKDKLIIGGREFNSRLFLGTGKFSSAEIMKEAILKSEASVVTVALKRVSLKEKDSQADLAEHLDSSKYLILPNTSGATCAEEAVRLARLGQAAGFGDFVKLEIHPDPNYLLPDPVETLKATEILSKEGFKVMAYMGADPMLALHLQDAGAAAFMPLGSPIGTNRGVETRGQVQIMIDMCNLPVVVDAGIGLPSHASEAMEMGADAVMINTAVAIAKNPVEMGIAFAKAVEAGRLAYLNQGASSSNNLLASPTSPLTAFLD